MRTDKAWNWWGKRDPYFGVLTEAKYKSGNLDLHKAEFFETGERHVSEVLARIEQSFGPLPRGSTLDFGCGVGRLLIPLAQRFETVAGLDISPAMLDEAARNLADRNIAGVDLRVADDGLSALGGRKFDLVHTYIVLQHIARSRGYVLIGRLLDHVAASGAIFLHFSLKRRYSPIDRVKYRMLNDVPGVHLLVNLLTGRRLTEPPMRMSEYDLATVIRILRRRGFSRLMVELEDSGPIATAVIYSRRDSGLGNEHD